MPAKPSLAFFLVIALTSASALAYEVLLMRLFSIIQWHHFAYMIISLALLGYGVSGVFLALYREKLAHYFSAALIVNLLLFGLGAPVCFLLAQTIPFNPAEIFWTPVQLLHLCGIYLLLAVPFFFAANVVGLSFYRYQKQASMLYAADLIGAGAGSIGIILLLFLMFPEKILIFLGLVGVFAALALILYAFRDDISQPKPWLIACGVIAIVLLFMPEAWTALKVSPYKSERQLLLIPGTEIAGRYSSPLGLIHVVKSSATPLRYAPGLSLNATAEPPEQLAVFTDADGMSAITRYTGKREALSYLDQTTSALPYHLKALDKILVLGAGSGGDVLQALYHGINHIDAVELNPQIIDLVKLKYDDFAGGLYSGDHVKVYPGEARSFVATSYKKFDLINVSLLDAFGSSAGGLYSMAENYLYTGQAIEDFLNHLTPEGYLSITRWIKIPPRDEPKLLATVINALKKAPSGQPGRQLLMIRSWQTSTLIIKNGVITADEITRLKNFCDQHSFDLVYYPGITDREVNRFNIQLQPYLYQATVALLGGGSEAFKDDYKFNIEPSTDDRPYFFHFFKWKTLPEIVSLMDSGGVFLLESGYLLLISALLQAVAASLLLIVLPLKLWKSKLGVESAGVNYLPALAYFFCLGLAFLFIEMAYIQKFVLILQHPVYAVTFVLSAFLLSAGTGSYFSRTLVKTGDNSLLKLSVTVIAGLSAVYALGFETITAFLLETGSMSRYLTCIILIAPLGFFMGVPFPLGLAKLGELNPALIPWAWGINGCASVISSILATLIAMQFGFTVLIFLAVGLYGMAAWCFSGSGFNVHGLGELRKAP